MINNPKWSKSRVRPYFHQLSPDLINKLGNYQNKLEDMKIEKEAYLNELKQILSVEIKRTDFLTFALSNYTELLSYIASGRVSIRLHIDETGRIWFGVG